jgi:hypothetical protein
MNRRQRKKLTLKHAPRWHGKATTPARKEGIYFENYCCAECYWKWGWSFENRHCYKTDCKESNYKGLLKKYWKSSDYEYSVVDIINDGELNEN